MKTHPAAGYDTNGLPGGAGWGGPKPERHHDHIDAGDFPSEWLGWLLSVEVEAKAKELAVASLIADLHGEGGAHAR